MVDFFTTTNIGILLLTLGQVLLVLVPLLVSLAFLLYADRKIWAAVQMRRGPNVVGVFGLLQSFADFLKYIVEGNRRAGGCGQGGLLSCADDLSGDGHRRLGRHPVQ